MKNEGLCVNNCIIFVIKFYFIYRFSMTRRKNFEKSFGDFLRTLKMPTKLDKLMEILPKPEGSIPNFGLPRWQIMSLDSKLPLIPAPKHTYYFTRKKIGQSLFVGSKYAEFNLNDPYNYEMTFPYDSLHDKHLTNYFSHKNIVKYLIKCGFVTKNLDAICTLKEYNMYRKYLKKLFGDIIKKELKHQSDIFIDKKIIKNAEIEAQKDTEKIKLQEQRKAMRVKMFEDLILREKEKLRKQKSKAVKDKKRMEKFEKNKKEKLRQIKLKSKIHNENVKRKRRMMIKKYENKLINILLKRARKEKIREKTLREKKIEETEKKRRNLEYKWQRKQQLQRQQIATEKFLLEYVMKRREISIKNYNKKVNKISGGQEKENVGELKHIKANEFSKRKKKISHVKKNASEKLKIKKFDNNNNNNNKEPVITQFKDINDDEELLSSKGSCLMTDKCKCDDLESEFCADH